MAAVASPQSISVLICTYRRPDALARCLIALANQDLRPQDVIIVVRESDTQTRNFLMARSTHRLPLQMVLVSRPGTVHALNAGLDACRTDVLAVTDDDTVPRSDWLRRIFAHYVADPQLGGLGGRDRCYDGENFDDRKAATVGHITWYGRAIGNHHLGFGAPRDVDNLKGANMSYRALAFSGIRFDRRLRGQGAQPLEDSCFSLAVRRTGWRMRYDPEVVVDHYAAQRKDPRHYVSIDRVKDTDAFRSFAYNNVVAYWDEFSAWRHVVFIIWSMLIGTAVAPGLLQALRYTPSLGWGAWHRFFLMQQGKLQAYCDLIVGRINRAASADCSLPLPSRPDPG